MLEGQKKRKRGSQIYDVWVDKSVDILVVKLQVIENENKICLRNKILQMSL